MISAACPLAGDEHSSLANAELTFGTVTTPGGRARWIAVGQDSVDPHDAPDGLGRVRSVTGQQDNALDASSPQRPDHARRLRPHRTGSALSAQATPAPG